MSTIDQVFEKEDAKPTNKFNMIYKTFYCVFECEDDADAEKWVKSIKLCKENISDYEHELMEDESQMLGHVELDKNRYASMDVFHNVTGRSAFMDFKLLVDAHEQKVMV